MIDGDPIDPHPSRCQLDRPAGPCEVVRAPALNPERRELGRHLVNLAHQRGHGGLNLLHQRDFRIFLVYNPPVRVQRVAPRPSRITVRYDFGIRWIHSTRRVAAPTQTTSTPVASGSRVPACPVFARPVQPRDVVHHRP